MCGILVSYGLDQPFSHLRLSSLRRRGPDAVGFWSGAGVNIGQTRLAIVGLDDRGTAPIENDTHVMAYNGEIYNFEAIRERLQREGLEGLEGANDAEVLLHAWSRWGMAVLSDLDGFWAFVVYDKNRRSLSLVRDQLGIKPLYYWINGAQICVASTIRALLEAAGWVTEIDYEALSEYTAYQLTFGDKTFIGGLKKVLPGHVVQIDLDSAKATFTCYEDILQPGDISYCGEATDDWLSETRELLVSCVLESTRSDVPYATLCSGGIDSSLLTSIAQPEIAYHCNYTDPECNETFFAQRVVDDLPTRLYVVNAAESFNVVDRLSSIVEDFDDLTVGSVILPLDDLFAQVKRRHKVVLTGTGGDELFAGYVRYQLALGECFQDSYRGMFESMASVVSVADRFERCHRKGRTEYYRFYQADVESTFRKAYESCKSEDDIHAMLTFDRRYFLPALLNIDDRMSGRHSLESRPSMLHQRFVRHLLKMDPGVLTRGNELKTVLRSIAAPLLPRAVIARQDKMGFTTPVGTFMQQSAHVVRQQLQTSRFRDLYRLEHLNIANESKFSREVFGLLMVDLWLNRYIT